MLQQGRAITMEIDLKLVQKVIIGLPAKTTTNALLMFFARREVESSNSYINNTMILKLNNSEYLPLYIFGYEGGLEIMNGIVNILSSKIDNNYVFNEKETKVLRKLKTKGVNKIIQI